MKLNIDCVRDVMLTIEDQLGFGEEWSIYKLHTFLPDYTTEDLHYTCLKLLEGGYLNAVPINKLRCASPVICRIRDLTFSGHEFLETIRPKTVFDKTKSTAKKLGTQSLGAIVQIATSVLSEVITSSLDK